MMMLIIFCSLLAYSFYIFLYYVFSFISDHALSHIESSPERNIGDQESFSKLQEILYNDLDPEMHHLNPVMSSSGYIRNKKSSVSWLLAAAIRMCQKHPEQCLKKDMQHGKMDYKALVDGGG